MITRNSCFASNRTHYIQLWWISRPHQAPFIFLSKLIFMLSMPDKNQASQCSLSGSLPLCVSCFKMQLCFNHCRNLCQSLSFCGQNMFRCVCLFWGYASDIEFKATTCSPTFTKLPSTIITQVLQPQHTAIQNVTSISPCHQ